MTGRIPDSVITEVLNATDIVDVVGSHVKLLRKGAQWWGLCPFHSEKTPSFSVSQDKNLYYCFGCGKGGSVINFLMEIDNASFPETVKGLAERAGVPIPDTDFDRGPGVKVKALEELYNLVSKTFQWLFNNRPDASDARTYIESRGISRETCEAFHVGWAPPDGKWLYNFLIGRSYSPELLAVSGLFSSRSPKWSLFINRVMFPIMPDAQRTVAFTGRSLDNQGPKYINTPEIPIYSKRNQLYGLGQAKEYIRKSGQVYLCEGAMDVIACHQAGVKETVAPLGTAFTEQQARILRRQAESLVCMFDGDAAGMNAAMKTAVIAESQEFIVKAIPVPKESDPADILIQQGPETLQEIVANPLHIFNYLLYYYVNSNIGNPNGNQKIILRNLAPYLDAVKSQLNRDNCLKQLAEAINADTISVIHEYQGLHRREERIRIVNNDKKENPTDLLGDELYLMMAVAVKPEFFSLVQANLAPEVFRNKYALTLYRILEELIIGRKSPNVLTDITVQIAERLDNSELSRLILEKASTGEFSDAAVDTIMEKIHLLQVRSLKDERRALINAMSKNNRDSQDYSDHNKVRLIRIQQIGQTIQELEEQVKRK